MMNSKFTWPLLVLLSLIFFSNCTKDDPLNIPPGTFSLRVDGKLYESSAPSAIYLEEVFLASNLTLAGGNIANTFGILLYVPDGMKLENKLYHTLTEACNTEEEVCGILQFHNLLTGYGGTSNHPGGEMEISFSSIDYQTDGHCIGAFSGILINENEMNQELMVTDGKFNLQIQ